MRPYEAAAAVLAAQTALACVWLLWRRRGRRARDADGQPWEPPVLHVGAPLDTQAARTERRRPGAVVAAAPTPEHPHADVIQGLSKQAPPLQIPAPAAVPALPPLGSGKHEYVFVDTPSHLAACAMELFEQDRIALDVEHHATHSYAGQTCLLQLSTGAWRKDFLVDCLALRDDMRLLDPVLSSPRILKVVHGCGSDVVWLQRDFGLFLVNVFDTEKACQVLGFRQRSLGYLLQRFCGIQVDKSVGQLADWRQRPLPQELVDYARLDVRYLLFIADSLGELLLQEAPPRQDRHHQQQQQQQGQQAGEAAPPPSIVQLSPEARQALEAAMAQPHSKLERAVHRSQAVTLTLYKPTPPEAAVAAAATGLVRRHLAAALEQHPRLTSQQVQHLETVADCVHVLASWRDAAARAADEGLLCLLPDAELLRLAEAAAASVGPDACNLRGRAQGFSEAQLLGLLEAAPEPAAAAERAGEAAAAAAAVEAERADEAAEAAAAAGDEEQEGGAVAEPAGAADALRPAAAAAAANGAGTCGCFPAMLCREAATVAAALSEAASGQRPWVSPEVQDLLQEAAGGGAAALGGSFGGSGNRAAKRRDPAAFRAKLASRFAAKNTVYENCQMYSMEGELLCHTDRKKLEWYLKKGLATKMSDNPLCVRLTFQHTTGDQQAGTSEFYTVEKNNQCVACGEEGHYLRYRVVPTCYRKAMPVRLKSHRSHDVVLLCVTCHELAHTAAEKLKRSIAEEMGVPLLQPLPRQAGQAAEQQGAAMEAAEDAAAGAAAVAPSSLQLHPYNVRRAALALQFHGAEMPLTKRRELESQIRQYLGSQPAGLAAGPSEAEGEEPIDLSELELFAGLLAGLGRRTRRRTLKRWVRRGQQLPPELAAEAAEALAAEAAGSGAGQGQGAEDDEGEDEEEEQGPPANGDSSHAQQQQQQQHGTGEKGTNLGSSDLRNTGHLWHGQLVVERLEKQGGEQALLDLCRCFRQDFVDALQPQFLPPGWSSYHFSRREFGEHSIYRAEEEEEERHRAKHAVHHS